MMKSKYIAAIIGISLLAIVMSGTVNAQGINPMTPKEQILHLAIIPFRVFFYILYVAGTFPIFVVSGFTAVWNSWGMPSFTEILGGITTVAPEVFKDSLFLLAFPIIAETVILGLIPILGWMLLPPVWAITTSAVLIFAIVDFFSKVSHLTETPSAPEREGNSGWWN